VPWWDKYVVVLAVGYMTMTRSFAYLGIAPLNLFVGDLTLAAFLILRLPDVFDRWVDALFRPSVLNGLALSLLAFFSYGVFEICRGISNDYPPLQVMQNFVFHAYPLYLFMAFWVGRRNTEVLSRAIHALAWFNGVYGVAYVLLLDHLQRPMPGVPGVVLFGQPAGAPCAILGLLAIEPRIRRIWPQLFLNAFVLLALQVRADFVGTIAGLAIWVTMTGKIGRALNAVAGLAVVLLIGYVTDFNIPGTGNRGGEISTRAVIGRTLAPLDPDLASEYSQGAKSQAGSVIWRQRWWQAIWDSVLASQKTTLIGHGYGYPLSKLVPYIRDETVRTPHNVFYYALGYGGWFGVSIFFFFQSQIAWLLWLAFRQTGQSFGLMLWFQVLTTAFFSNVFETPFGAIPFYLLTGLAIAPLLRSEYLREDSTSPQFLSATGR
jgi:hypothetical protein